MRKPLPFEEAAEKNLVVEKGIHTFSNGSEWECWADSNCLSCRYYEMETPFSESECAFEAAAMLGSVSPALALLFGWTESVQYPGSYNAPQTCRFFREQGDDDDGPEQPGDSTDPAQLVLLADPTEDASIITNATADVFASATEPR